MGKKLFLFAAAAVALASCTETDLSGDTSFAKESTSDAIQFSAKAGNAGTTRAGDVGTITTASLKTGNHNEGFGVMGYQMTENWANDQSSTTPNFMYNEQVTWDANGYWTYSPVKYWPNGNDAANTANRPSNSATSTNTDKLNFFAYAPWVDVATDYTTTSKATVTLPVGGSARDVFYTKNSTSEDLGNGIAVIKANTVAAAPEVYYRMTEATTTAAVDLIWGVRGSKVYEETDATNNGNASDALGDSYNINLLKQDVPETVNFLFKHALSKIGGNTSSKTSTTGAQKCGFKVVLDVDGNGNGLNGVDNQSLYLGTGFNKAKTLVTIKEVKIQDGKSAASAGHIAAETKSNLKNSGWFNLATGEWSSVDIITKTGATEGAEGATYNVTASSLAESTYKLNDEIKEGTVSNASGADWTTTNSGGATGVETTPKNVFADLNGSNANDVPALLMIPASDTPQTLYVTVDYLVRTADPKLSGGFSQVEQVVTNEVSLAGLETNKYYTLVMHLGLTSVKFSAIVADWTSSDDAEYNEGGTQEGQQTSSEEVWLPSNVINATTSTAAAAGTASNVNVKASQTPYTITLSGLAVDQKIQATLAAESNIGDVKITDENGADLKSAAHTLVTADVNANGEATIYLTLTANTKVKAKSNLLTITQTDGTNELSKTTVNIVQSAFDIKLSETTNGKVVTVMDGDGTPVNITNTTYYTVVVKDSKGTTLTSGYTPASDGTITMDTAGTYTVIVTYDDGPNDPISRTIHISL